MEERRKGEEKGGRGADSKADDEGQQQAEDEDGGFP